MRNIYKFLKKNMDRFKHAVLAFGCAAAAVMILATPVFAASSVTSSFETLQDIVSALVQAIGTIILLWGFFEMGVSMQSGDGTQQSLAFKRIGGGLVMVLAPVLLEAFI